MRSSIIIWWVLTGFFLLMALVYTGMNLIEHQDRPLLNAIEWTGTVALFFSAAMGAMVTVYLQRVHKAQGGESPEDILTADIDDGDPELGEFSPWSWWPIALAGAAAIMILGLAVGYFLLPIGLGIFLVAIVGWVYEYYRGNFAR